MFTDIQIDSPALRQEPQADNRSGEAPANAGQEPMISLPAESPDMEMFQRTYNSEDVSSVCETIALEFNLTLREFELIFLLSLYGFSNKDLARSLVISEKTVKNHIANVQRKTNTKSTRELMSLIINRR